MSKSHTIDYLLATEIDPADHDAWVDEDWGDLLAAGKGDIEDCVTDWELQNAEEDWNNYVRSRVHARECLKNSAQRDYERAREEALYEYMDTGLVEGFTPTPADEILRQNWLGRRERNDIHIMPSHLF
jgi:hypothetical protein